MSKVYQLAFLLTITLLSVLNSKMIIESNPELEFDTLSIHSDQNVEFLTDNEDMYNQNLINYSVNLNKDYEHSRIMQRDDPRPNPTPDQPINSNYPNPPSPSNPQPPM